MRIPCMYELQFIWSNQIRSNGQKNRRHDKKGGQDSKKSKRKREGKDVERKKGKENSVILMMAGKRGQIVAHSFFTSFYWNADMKSQIDPLPYRLPDAKNSKDPIISTFQNENS